MSRAMRKFSIKKIFFDYFKFYPIIENDTISLRLFDPDRDVIFPQFSRRDWNLIFTDVDEASFKEMAKQYIDRVILVAIDKQLDAPFGFICIQESHSTPMEVSFHGGTWEHDIKHILLEYSATDLILEFLINRNFDVRATCFLSNERADRFQKSLGFDEYKRDIKLSYKKLNVEHFKNNNVRKRRNVTSMLNPWLNIEWNNTVADCDKDIISPAYCAEKEIDISQLPEPYTGNINSNVVCLNLNPGIGKCEACFRFNKQLLELTQKTLRHQIDHSMWIEDIRCPHGGLHEGCEWWRDRTKNIKDVIDNKAINMFVLEFFPYHTKHTFNYPKLPSDDYRNQLLLDAIKKKKLIVIMRGEKRWLAIKELNLGDELRKLKEENKLIVLSNPQNVFFSLERIGEEAWKMLIDKLK